MVTNTVGRIQSNVRGFGNIVGWQALKFRGVVNVSFIEKLMSEQRYRKWGSEPCGYWGADILGIGNR